MQDDGYGYGGRGRRADDLEPGQRGYGPEGPRHGDRGYGYGGERGGDRAFGREGDVYRPGRLRGYGRGGADDDDRRGDDDRREGTFGSAMGSARRSQGDRSFMDRAGDEIASWMGDDHARQRREQDYRGRGPKGYRRPDARILEDVNDRLFDAPHIDATDIEVAVTDGEVTLEGKVDSRRTRRDAEDCAEEVSGVRHVQNNLRVRNPE